jgi:ATP-binding cassette subfamily B protein
MWRARLQVFSSSLGTIGMAIGLFLLLRRAIGGGIGAGDVVFYYGMVQQLSGAVFGLIAVRGRIRESSMFIGEFLDFLSSDQEVEGQRKNARYSINESPALVLSEARFTYPGSNRAALVDVSLAVSGGEWICVLGENGSGKSTLLKLVAGLYQPSSGRIQLSMQSNEGMKDATDAISGVAYVEQQSICYKLTIRENILLGRQDQIAATNEIEHLLDLVGLLETIRELPSGIDTPLGKEFDEGYELSGGEMQRLAIARAAASRPRLLLLDEPTSSLDPASELVVMRNLRDELSDCTCLMATHRPGPVEFADRVVRISAGRLIDTEQHQSVVNNWPGER